jgi:hypothetical protein
MARPQAFEQSYPEALWKHERRFLEARRGRAIPGDRPPDDVLGVALSGGGIRSATFCLGVFQALARHRLLSRIDYLSTVSGGGYFGSFLGRLFTRDEIRSPADVERLLYPDRDGGTPPDTAGPQGKLPDVIRWLRENGRYLSPNGAGDLLLGGAIMLRNWAAIHVVLLSFVLLAFLTAQAVRVGAEVAARRPDGGSALGVCEWFLCGAHWLWWSPFLIVPAVLLVAWVVPTAWAYWLTGRWGGNTWFARPAAGVAFSAVVALGLLLAGPWRVIGGVSLAVIALTVFSWAAAKSSAKSRAQEKTLEGAARLSEEEQRIFALEEQRNRLSNWLKAGLVAMGGSLAFAVIDSLGQTMYLASRQADSNFTTYLGTALGALAGSAAFAQRIATAVSGTPHGKRPRLPMSIVAGVAALIIIGVLLLMVSVVAHAVAWRFQPPSPTPRLTWLAGPEGVTVKTATTKGASGGVTVTTSVALTPTAPDAASCGSASAVPCPRGRDTLRVLGLVWLVVGVFCVLFGRIWLFVNNSSLHSMYSARLTRAYLGASNPLRARPDNETITRVLPGDNIDPAGYWTLPAGGSDPKQRPLHLINVTINETMDGRSQVQQQDRKGLGFAIGPCALSVGVRHHAVFPSHEALRNRPQDVQVFPAGAGPARPADGGQPYRVFDIVPGQWRGGEQLSMGAWVGISGAAFSTGMGARTSLGLSLLCGFGNVRLGYWWDSAIGRLLPPAGSFVLRQIERAFPVQVYLLSEFLSRFYGTSRARWFLSDGGHFENMGGYELIRRRLARILLVDAEADPTYTFEGLADLVRKARLDFGAEITFLTAEELDAAVAPSHRYLFGTLEQLRRGRWSKEPVPDARTGRARRSIKDPIDETRYSLSHAALARVRFADEPDRRGWLVYLKPTLTGDEPADVTQYHRTHASFPQETTADQFFDEAQWESYRMLGFLIASDVLGDGRPSGAVVPPEARTPREILSGA